MKYSQGAFRTIRETSHSFESKNHELLIRAGFIDQVGSGIYTMLPLGKKVLTKIENIVRWHLNELGAQEILMPALQPKALWEKTGRWNTFDVLFKVESQYADNFGLGPSHEEIVTPLAKKFIQSYRDLPISLYQIATKFRDEARPKSGILRGREFGMKDMYSFHANKENFEAYYKKVMDTYVRIFADMGLVDIKITEASGGSFSKKNSHEFNVITSAGEVDLVYCESCEFAQNEEVFDKNLAKCSQCGGSFKKNKAIEIGNIFDLGTKFSDNFEVNYTDEAGEVKLVCMGCYGIGTTRLLGAVVEVYNDADGIAWPKNLTPTQVHLIDLARENKGYANAVYKTLRSEGISVLFDDRTEVQAGQKFADADLIGIPVRLVVSDKTGKDVEWKERGSKKMQLLDLKTLITIIDDFYAS